MKFMNESIADFRAFKESIKKDGQDADLSTNRDESSKFDNVSEAFDNADAELDALGAEQSLDEPTPELGLDDGDMDGLDIVGDEVSVSMSADLWKTLIASLEIGTPEIDDAIAKIEEALYSDSDDLDGDDLMDSPEDDFGADLGDDLGLDTEDL